MGQPRGGRVATFQSPSTDIPRMTLDIKLYDRVLALANALTEAVERDDDHAFSQRYGDLETLCAEARAVGTAHPFYLESLGDFTLDDEDAIDIYEQALELANSLDQAEFRASIQLAIAERYRDLHDLDAALAYASEAQKSLAVAADPVLQQELTVFLNDLKQT